MTFEQILLPTPKHNNGPHILQKIAMLLMSVLLVFSLVGMNLHAMLWQSSEWLVGAVLSGAQIFAIHTTPSEGVTVQAAVGTLSGSTAPKALLMVDKASATNSPIFQSVYAVFGAMVFVLLALSIVISSYYARPLQVAYGIVLLFIMTGLFYVHVGITTSTLAKLSEAHLLV